jgi:Txe/YoeB family toxin of Txe-Axe toxin-antitoxin module
MSEPLKYEYQEYWSRRVNQGHRRVYKDREGHQLKLF